MAEPAPKRRRRNTHQGFRQRLESFKFLNDVVEALKISRNIVVLAGAGISVSAGIPDFRSKNGIYSMDIALELPQPECLFDIHYFKDDPLPFFHLARKLYPGNFQPTKTHHFIHELEKRGKLLRCFTQNIDMLEEAAGISTSKVIHAHGSFATATCMECKKRVTCQDLRADIMATPLRVPTCTGSKRRRNCRGVLKPNITFFGESIPAKVKRTLAKDRAKVDLLLVIGTSLQVAPMSGVLNFIPGDVPQILINLDHVKMDNRHGSEGFDVELLGESDFVVEYLTSKLRWGETPLTGSAFVPDEPKMAALRQYTFQGFRGVVDTTPKASACASAHEASAESHKIFIEVFNCDACGSRIRNERYNCTECFDFDLCQTCALGEAGRAHKSTTNRAEHNFVAISIPALHPDLVITSK
jgi:NAD-dependent deacetylase sirtuin 1